jgi:hypothetical protein
MPCVQFVQGGFPDPALIPTAEMVVDGLPRGKILREHPPLGARLGNIQNRIDDLLARVLAGVAAAIPGLKMVFD